MFATSISSRQNASLKSYPIAIYGRTCKLSLQPDFLLKIEQILTGCLEGNVFIEQSYKNEKLEQNNVFFTIKMNNKFGQGVERGTDTSQQT